MKKFFLPTEENNYHPGIFSRISTAILVGIIALLLLVSVSMSVVINQTGLLGAVLPSVLVDLTNEARVEKNYKPLTISPELTLAAQLKANDMVEKGYFSHNSPDNLTPWYWIGVSGYQFIYAGENLAVDYDYSKDVNSAWLNSPGHAANIYNPNYTQIGIATAEGDFKGRQATYVVQLFGTPVPSESRKPVAEVKEAQVSVVEERIINDTEKVIVVQNDEYEDIATTTPGVVEQEQAPGYERYSSWYEYLILNPAKLTEYALYAAVILIALALLVSIIARGGQKNPKGLAYGIFILVVLLTVIYLNRSGMITEFLLKYFEA